MVQPHGAVAESKLDTKTGGVLLVPDGTCHPPFPAAPICPMGHEPAGGADHHHHLLRLLPLCVGVWPPAAVDAGYLWRFHDAVCRAVPASAAGRKPVRAIPPGV